MSSDPLTATAPGPLHDAFPGDSELAGLMRAHDWAATPLGPPARWPEALKAPLRMMLTSRFEMWLGWGPDLLFFYNDAYMPTLGIKHPSMFARPFREVWAEVYADVEDQVRSVMEHGRPTWNKALLLILERSGVPEETYHTFSYSPLLDQGLANGLMCVVTEETERVVNERRLNSLRLLSESLAGNNTRKEVRDRALAALAECRRDFPFSLLCESLPDGRWVAHASSSDAAPLAAYPWPFERLAGAAGLCVPLEPELAVPSGPWARPPTQVLIVPVARSSSDHPAGALVLGVNPYRPFDADYESFAHLVAGQIAAALSQVAALEMERRRADQVWTNARDMLVVIDHHGIFRSVSPSWGRVLGHRIDQVVGRSFTAFIHPDDARAMQAGLAPAASGADMTAFESRYFTDKGETRWIAWHASTEDRLVYAIGRDVTEERHQADALRSAEDALRQAQKMEAVGQLTGGIAHDFNNLLTGVTGSLELMRSRIAQGRFDAVDRYMQAAEGAAKRAATLTQRLLAFSRRQTLDPRPTDLNRLIAGMEDLIRRTVGPGVEIEVVGAGGLWPTLIDAGQLDNALLNLCINGRDAMAAGGRMTIETGNKWLDDRAASDRDLPPGQYVSLCVTDTGTGMTPEVIKRAFDPFFTTKPIGSGTGLGLSMIYGFVRQSGGQVRIYSELGQGTTICLYLPRHHGEVHDEVGDASDGQRLPAREGETVLVVDDEPAIRMLVTEVLEESGYGAVEAADGHAGLRILESGIRVDLLITDVGLPGGMNGRQFADAARALRPALKILFITGYAQNAAVGNGHLDPGMEVVTKPFGIQALSAKIREIIKA